MPDAEYDYSATIDEFDRYVRQHFAYLETDYGFKPSARRSYDLNEPRDAGVSVRYTTDFVSLQIGLSLIGAGIGVTFKNERWINTPPDKRVKWVTLDSVVAFKTDGHSRHLLDEFTSTPNIAWPGGVLLQNMELAIQKLAWNVKQYASDIIGGDVSSFLSIAANEHERKRNRNRVRTAIAGRPPHTT